MIITIILAAGKSSRLGISKQLLDYHGQPLLRRTTENILKSKVDRVFVVLGHEAKKIRPVLQDLPVTIVQNPHYATGQSSSIKTGIASCIRETGLGESAWKLLQEKAGIMFALGDQPMVRPETINLLIDYYRQYHGIIVPYHRGIRGNPVLFSGKYLPEMMFLTGDVGAKAIINRHSDETTNVKVSDAGVIQDIDTWEDYHNLMNS